MSEPVLAEYDIEEQEVALKKNIFEEVDAAHEQLDRLNEARQKEEDINEKFAMGLAELHEKFGSSEFEDADRTETKLLERHDGSFAYYNAENGSWQPLVAEGSPAEHIERLRTGPIVHVSQAGNGGSIEVLVDERPAAEGKVFSMTGQAYRFVGERLSFDEVVAEDENLESFYEQIQRQEVVDAPIAPEVPAQEVLERLFVQQEVTEQLVQEWPLDIAQTTQSEQAMAEALVLFPPTLSVVTAQGIEATPMTEVMVQMQEAPPGTQVVLPYRMEQTVPQGAELVREAMVFERHETGIHVSFVEAQPLHFGGVEHTAMVTHEVITQEKSETIEAVTVLAPPIAEAVRMDTVLSEPSSRHEENSKPMATKVEMPVANPVAWNEFKPSAPDVISLSEQVMPPVFVAAPAVESQTQAVFPTVLPSTPASENEFKITATELTPTIVLSPDQVPRDGSADEVYNVSEKQSVEGAVTIPTSEVVAPVAVPETSSSIIETVSPALSSSETLIIATALEAENPAAISTSSPEDVITHQPTTAIQTAGAVQQPQEQVVPIEITRNEQVGITTIVEKPEEQAVVAETIVNEVAAVTETVTTLEQQPGTSVAVARATVTEIINRSEAVVAEIVETPGTEVVSSSFESRLESVPRYVSEPVIANEQPRARRVIRITAEELATSLVPADEDAPTRLTVERSQRPRPVVGNSPSSARRATAAAINAASQAIAA